MGDGSFVLPLIEKFMHLHTGSTEERLEKILSRNVYGVELDPILYERCLDNIRQHWGRVPQNHNFIQGDFFRSYQHHKIDRLPNAFSYIVGNPPFGGTLDTTIQDELDEELGFRDGHKIKKETYSFFLVKSLDLLAPQGRLLFICSNTFLTISTMRGLRQCLMNRGRVTISDLSQFSMETSHPMVVVRFTKSGWSHGVFINEHELPRTHICLTGNLSWRIAPSLLKYFSGPSLGDFMVASSGMTVGRNEYFVRAIQNGTIMEPYDFEFYDDPITLEKELARARLGKLSQKQISKIRGMERTGMTRRNIHVKKHDSPIAIRLPHPDYCYYNKGGRGIVYSPPTHVIYWKDDGDAVLTFKKNGNWYLHGVGGGPFFKKNGLTWQLISQRLRVRHLPEGYILDSGAPCAFLRKGIQNDEFYFIFGWTLTCTCNSLLKEVINHTKNIQSKDFERLPYPFWVDRKKKITIIQAVKRMIHEAMKGMSFDHNSPEISWLEEQFTCAGTVGTVASHSRPNKQCEMSFLER